MNVLVISVTFIPSVLLCGHCQLDYLEKVGKVNYRFAIAHFLKRSDVNWADIIVFLRSDSDIEAYVAKMARKAGKHCVFVMDDDLLNVPDYISSAPYYNLSSTKENMRFIMKNCDTFLTPSPVILEKYGSIFKNTFNIAEPSINRINKKEKNEKIRIGFAGSIDRTKDLNQILEGTITKLVEKYGDSISIEFMGAKPDFVDKYHLVHLPYQDGYDAYTAYMSQRNWDIGLAPMPESNFHRCKYFNKYVEYASFGIVGVYTNCEPYVFGIRNEENGLLVKNNTDEWFNAICRLIEDNKLRKKISDNCLKEANEIYSLQKQAEDFYQKITYGYDANKEVGKIGGLLFVKTIIFFKRVYRKIQEQGKNFPSWFKKKINKKINDAKDRLNNNKALKQLKKEIQNKKTICIFSQMYDDSINTYNQRVKFVDEQLKDYYRIYIVNDSSLSNEYIRVSSINNSHCILTFNSFDIRQANQMIELISLSKNVLIHSVVRFMREKLSPEMFHIFDLQNVQKIWDTHGAIPEEYNESANYHTEKVTNDIEKVFYEKVNVVIVDNEKLKGHFVNKYHKEQNFVIINSDNKDISKALK